MDLKYTNWPAINLAEFKEAQNWGHVNPATNKKYLRGSQHYNRTHELDENGWLKLWIDYTDPACPFRDEFTEEFWPANFAPGTEEVWTWVYKFGANYRPENCKTPKSIFQMYCRDTKGLSGGTGDVMFQLELTGETQVKPDGTFPIGSVQVIHQACTSGKYRKSTLITPNGNEDLTVKVRVVHGLQGYIKCELNGQIVYEVNDSTCFSWDPTASAQGKIGIYDHMINNEGSRAPGGNNNRLKHLNAGIDRFEIAVSPVTIIRRYPNEPAFGAWIEALADPYRQLCANDEELQGQITELQAKVIELEEANETLSTENASLNSTLGQANVKNAELAGLIDTAFTAINSAKASSADLTDILN